MYLYLYLFILECSQDSKDFSITNYKKLQASALKITKSCDMTPKEAMNSSLIVTHSKST